MKVKSITVECFKSIYKKTTIEFSDTGLWKISGDVGAGKTTLGEAILFGLFGTVKDTNVKNLISWNAKKCTSSIELESRGHNIIINRLIRKAGQGNLEIYIDGKPLEYTNKRGGQQILEEDYFDITRTAVESLCIISLNNFKSIVKLSAGSAEARKFIDDVFGFNIVNKYIEKTKEHLNTANTKYLEITAVINTLNSQREKYILQKEAIDTDIDCDKIDALKASITSKEKELKDLREDYTNKSNWLQDRKDISTKQMNIIKERGKHIKATIEKLKNGICPLCGGQVNQESLDEYNKQREDLLEQYNVYKDEYNLVTEKLNNLRNENTTLQSNLNNEIHSLNNEISKISMQKTLMSNNYDKLISDIDISINEKTKELIAIDIERNKWQTLYDKLYKESRSTLLRHYIPALNKNINYYMQELQQPYNIKFDENFKCTISAFGTNDIPVNSLSVGQSKLVDTGVILGIIKTLLNGVNFNICFLDELVGNMHAELREIVCSMIKKNMPDKLIYIISHAEIDDMYFDGKIKVKLRHWEEDDKLIQNSEYIITTLNN